MAEVTPEPVAERLEQGDDDCRVVDIRHETDFGERHVPGSENVDVDDELTDDPDAALEELEVLPEDEEIVTVCASRCAAE
ncbi:rhodanese-like domain-containing protein [Natrialbaceae archaeon AArc-T1-2]|uniref:rhodanese-like domain-containing protein n=1 Tax=Natrialbaceae archaeon AArc-T1-2 TaxID=3053904 RepID=UPI00255AFCEF|nr:rhodanese-like domain-containing protein [Natrialbaceae archaeon AArc-T1-2]WIV66089.1 rhodanese-like domain-containing protein [Natrialbaceae archaeon AArc-T1-2]